MSRDWHMKLHHLINFLGARLRTSFDASSSDTPRARPPYIQQRIRRQASCLPARGTSAAEMPTLLVERGATCRMPELLPPEMTFYWPRAPGRATPPRRRRGHQGPGPPQTPRHFFSSLPNAAETTLGVRRTIMHGRHTAAAKLFRAGNVIAYNAAATTTPLPTPPRSRIGILNRCHH